MFGTLGNTRKNEVMLRYARKNKSALYLPRHKMIAQVKTQCYQGFVRLYKGKAHQFYTK